jgi:hypothetical protein
VAALGVTVSDPACDARNRWYFVKDAEHNENFSGGWIYCGNVATGC